METITNFIEADDIDGILSVIDINSTLSYNDFFYIGQKCASFISSNNAEKINFARRIAIHILNNWKALPSEIQPLWVDIIESLGFYPYLEQNKEFMPLSSLADEIRKESFASDYLPGKYFHQDQKKLEKLLFSDKNVVASAPTSFGKSLLIEELVASNLFKNIVIIQPTLALLDETRLKMVKYSNKYKIIVRTTQAPVSEKGNLFLLTAERVMEYEDLPHIDLLIIDEFYKLSLRRVDERADALNNAFLKIINKFNSKFYFLGPNIDNVSKGFCEKYNAVFYYSDYSLVDCNVVDMSNSNKNEKDAQKKMRLFDLLYTLREEQTLIYCPTPQVARRLANAFREYLENKEVKPSSSHLSIIDWMKDNVSKDWSLAKDLQYGIAVHDGSLQKHLGVSIIKYFNEGKLRCVFCTSTIIEGVNTSAKNVVLFESRKGGSELDYFDYSNIKGRSGRLMEHYIGTIYNFTEPPEKTTISIDIPFHEQEVITDEILVNIKKTDVKENVLDRYDKIYEEIPSNLLDIIKRNGVTITGQMGIYTKLKKDLQNPQLQKIICWHSLPNEANMKYLLNLGLKENLFDFNKKNGVFSVNQLYVYLNSYMKTQNLHTIVQSIYYYRIKKLRTQANDKQKSAYLDNAIETAYHIYRHWFLFTIPKSLRVIDSLQRFVCEEEGLKPGSYSYFVQQLENDFIRENLSILVEFGVPSSAVRKLNDHIDGKISEDKVIELVKKNREKLKGLLSEYEMERISNAL